MVTGEVERPPGIQARLESRLRPHVKRTDVLVGQAHGRCELVDLGIDAAEKNEGGGVRLRADFLSDLDHSLVKR